MLWKHENIQGVCYTTAEIWVYLHLGSKRQNSKWKMLEEALWEYFVFRTIQGFNLFLASFRAIMNPSCMMMAYKVSMKNEMFIVI